MKYYIKKLGVNSALIGTLYFCFISMSYAQQLPETQANFWQNVRFGGGLGLSFGNGFFAGNIAPIGMYQINEYVSTGVGLNFAYTSERDFYESFVLGGSVLGFFNPIREIQFSTEFQQSYVSRNFDERTLFKDDKYWVPALFLGLGYTTNNITFGIQYDILYDRNRSIYNDAWFPFVRVLF
jgi:hypothetical protein